MLNSPCCLLVAPPALLPLRYSIYDESGDYAGRDPDPNIRFELHRDNARDE